jgi:probable HAF family extracellular repeat protein
MTRRYRFSLVTAAAAILLVGNTTAFAQKGGGKQAPAYSYTDLGPYFNWQGSTLRSYGITNPDDSGVLRVVSRTLPVTWEVAAEGAVLAVDELPADVRVQAVNDNGMTVFTVKIDDAWVTLIDVPDLGVVEPPLADRFYPTAMNSAGQVVGHRLGVDGILWTVEADGGVSYRVMPYFMPLAINDLGMMAGAELAFSDGMRNSYAAIAWFEEGELQIERLPGLLPGNWGFAKGINNFGEVVGVSTSRNNQDGNFRAFLWRPSKGSIDLGTLGGTEAAANDINDRGQVVGWALTKNNQSRNAFIWDTGKMSDANQLVGKGSSPHLASLEAINDAGHSVGWWSTSHGARGTFLLSPNP